MSSGSMSDGNVIPSATIASSLRATRAISTVDESGDVLDQSSLNRGSAPLPRFWRRASRIARTPQASCVSMTGATSSQVGGGTPVETTGRVDRAVEVGATAGWAMIGGTDRDRWSGASEGSPIAHGLTIATARPTTTTGSGRAQGRSGADADRS